MPPSGSASCYIPFEIMLSQTTIPGFLFWTHSNLTSFLFCIMPCYLFSLHYDACKTALCIVFYILCSVAPFTVSMQGSNFFILMAISFSEWWNFQSGQFCVTRIFTEKRLRAGRLPSWCCSPAQSCTFWPYFFVCRGFMVEFDTIPLCFL